MRAISFTIERQPLPKQRPRVVNGRAHTPKKTRDYEQHVAWLARTAMGPRPPMVVPVCLEVVFYREGQVKADLDNLIKAVTDGMNGVAYKDDQQVRQLIARVEYGADEPCAFVIVREA